MKYYHVHALLLYVLSLWPETLLSHCVRSFMRRCSLVPDVTTLLHCPRLFHCALLLSCNIAQLLLVNRCLRLFIGVG